MASSTLPLPCQLFTFMIYSSKGTRANLLEHVGAGNGEYASVGDHCAASSAWTLELGCDALWWRHDVVVWLVRGVKLPQMSELDEEEMGDYGRSCS